MILCKRVLVLFLLLQLSLSSLLSQINNIPKLNKSSRKYITPVFVDDWGINEHSIVMKSIKPGNIIFLNGVEGFNISDNIVPNAGGIDMRTYMLSKIDIGEV